MNQPLPSKKYCVTLRLFDGSDYVTDQMVTFQGEPPYIITSKGLAFKKIYESSTDLPAVVYSQVSVRDLSSVAVVNG
ncbi:MAG: hypothetical protein EAZ18_13070 [Oscillatoriales cyanobacterium]|nr:MAG: hypothetical protein EAZ18_13070 [Oscillatoriales cyanobacterium]